MPYARPGTTRPLPRRTPPRTPWRRPAHFTGPAGSTIAQQLGPWNFTAKVYVAWDGPNTAYPAWIEVTEYVDIAAGITITRGRPDGESDPQVGTCRLTVDNTDGRWSQGNPTGPWAGQIRLGAWLRIDILPPSGTVSTRFVGFIQQLPVVWAGRYASTVITASDRFVLLSNAKKLQTGIAAEWIADPALGQYLAGYWPISEPAGSKYAVDASGLAPAGQSQLALNTVGTNFGNNITFAGTSGPSYDGTNTATFGPGGTNITGLWGSAGLPIGSYLRGNVGPMGNVAQITCWINTTTLGQPVWSWANPATNYAIGLMIDSAGLPQVFQGALSGSSSTITITNTAGLTFSNRIPIADGAWHQVSVKLQSSGSPAFIGFSVDGQFSWGTLTAGIGMLPDPGNSRFTLGGAEGWVNNGSSQLALYTGAVSDLAIHQLPNTTVNVDFYGPYQAGTQMWQGPNATYAVPESCGRRIIRIGSWAGLPTPVVSFTLPGFGNPATDVTPGVTPFFNIPAETAHPAGFQQVAGNDPLSSMRTASHTENMPAFVDQQGRITLQPSTLRQNPSPAFTIDANDLESTTQWANDFQYLKNQAVITPSGQGSLTVNTNGAASQNTYGLYSDSVDSVTVNAAESGSLGAAINFAGATPQPRHNPLACEVATLATQTGYGNAWYDTVLAAEISTVLQVVNWPSQSPGASSGSYYIEGYIETIGMGTHTFAWNTSPVQGATYQCDSPTLGLIDTPGITLAY